MTASPRPSPTSYDGAHDIKESFCLDGATWEVSSDNLADKGTKVLKLTVGSDDTNIKEEPTLFGRNLFARPRFSLPTTSVVAHGITPRRTLSEGQLSNVHNGNNEGTRHSAFLVEMLAARQQLKYLQRSATANERRKTWIEIQEDVDNCINALLKEPTHLQLDIADTDLLISNVEPSPPESAPRYKNDVHAHDDVNYRISRHLREPIAVSDEETGQSGKPVRVETALDAYQRGEFSTGQPDTAHLPSGLRSLSSPIKRPRNFDSDEFKKGSDAKLRKYRSAIGPPKEALTYNDQSHVHPALRTPTRAATSPRKKGSLHINQFPKYPTFRGPRRPILRYQFPESSDDDDDAYADDYWRSNRTSSTIRTSTTLTPSRTSGSGPGSGVDRSTRHRPPHPIRDGIIPPLPNPLTTTTTTTTTSPRRALTYYTPSPPPPKRNHPSPPTPKPIHLSPPPNIPTTPTRPPKRKRLPTPLPLHLSPPTPPPTRPLPLTPLEAAPPSTHRSQLLDALLGVPKGRPTRLGEAQVAAAAAAAAAKPGDHQSHVLDALLGVRKGEPTRLGVLFGADEGGGGLGGTAGDRFSVISRGSGGSGGGGSVRVKGLGGEGGTVGRRVREGLRRLRL